MLLIIRLSSPVLQLRFAILIAEFGHRLVVLGFCRSLWSNLTDLRMDFLFHIVNIDFVMLEWSQTDLQLKIELKAVILNPCLSMAERREGDRIVTGSRVRTQVPVTRSVLLRPGYNPESKPGFDSILPQMTFYNCVKYD